MITWDGRLSDPEMNVVLKIHLCRRSSLAICRKGRALIHNP